MLNKYLIVAIIGLAATMGLLTNKLKGVTADAVRWEQNYKESHLTNQDLNFKVSEFEDYLKTKDTQISDLLDSLKIKPKTVERIVKIKVTEIDSIPYEVPTKPVIVNQDTVFQFLHAQKCYEVGGFVKVKDDNCSLVFTKFQYNNELSEVYYQERKEWKLLFFKTRFLGKRELSVERVSKCGDTEYKTINIIKK